MIVLAVVVAMLLLVAGKSLTLALKNHDYTSPRDGKTWEDLIWGEDGKTYDAEADAEFTRRHLGDQGIQG